MSSTSPQSPTKPTVLSSRDINTSSPTKDLKKMDSKSDSIEEKKPKTMEYHRQVLQSRLEEDGAKKTYVSPSDTIMSPCTAKLSAYKTKQFGKAKPQSLFAKTAGKNVVVMEAEKKANNESGESV